MKRTKSKRGIKYPSEVQKARLVELASQYDQDARDEKEHPCVKFTPTFTRKTAFMRWHLIEKELNLIPGAIKSWREWRKTWSDIKVKQKKKQVLFSKELSRELDNHNSETPCKNKDELNNADQSSADNCESNPDTSFESLQESIESEQESKKTRVILI